MNRRKILTLIFIILVSFILRFYKLAEYPVGFHIDEATLGYNAYSLLETSRDENGNLLPLHTDIFGDFRPSGYQYLDILPVKVFGLNEFATRFPSAFFGAITPVVIFFFSLAVFNNFWLSILSAGLLTISPWHIALSRGASETNLALFFIGAGACFFLYGLIKREAKLVLPGTFLFIVSLLIYHTPRVFVPILVLTITAIFYSSIKKKKFIFPLICVGVIFIVSLLLVLGSTGGAGRFQQVSIFHFPEIRLVLEEQIREDGVAGMPILAVRFFHNKVVNYGFGYLKEYFRYFSLNFLFTEGGLPLWYKVPNMGLVYLVELPFLLVGLYLLIKNTAKNRLFLIPTIWLFLGPTVAALTRDDVPNILRSLVMLPALIMITAYGLYESWQLVKKKTLPIIRNLLLLFVVIAFSWNFAYFLHQYFIHGRLHRPWYRFNGFKEMVLVVNDLSSNYDKIVVTKNQGGIYMHFLFFQKFNPREYQKLGSPKDKDYGGFDKLIFVPKDCLTELPVGLINKHAKILYVANGNCEEPQPVSDWTKLIYREDGTVVFRIYPGRKF